MRVLSPDGSSPTACRMRTSLGSIAGLRVTTTVPLRCTGSSGWSGNRKHV